MSLLTDEDISYIFQTNNDYRFKFPRLRNIFSSPPALFKINLKEYFLNEQFLNFLRTDKAVSVIRF